MTDDKHTPPKPPFNKETWDLLYYRIIEKYLSVFVKHFHVNDSWRDLESTTDTHLGRFVMGRGASDNNDPAYG